MRMAMLASWQQSKSTGSLGLLAIIARNSAQIIFLEDRLSPDYKNTGTWTVVLLYPRAQEVIYL